MKALWKYKRFENISALKYERFENIQALLKNRQYAEIITGANFHFETVEFCILNNNYALCILLRKIPSSDESANILELLYTFLAYYWAKTAIILESWVLLQFSLSVFTTACSSPDLVGSVSSLCVWRCGHLLVLLLSEEEVQWSPLYHLGSEPWPLIQIWRPKWGFHRGWS
jgi:hypothetical protein